MAAAEARRSNVTRRLEESPLAGGRPGWLRSLAAGCAGLLLTTGLLLLALAAEAYDNSVLGTDSLIASGVVAAIAIWLLTAPGGAAVGDGENAAGRVAMRLLTLVPFAVVAVLYYAEHEVPNSEYERVLRVLPALWLFLPPLMLLLFLRLGRLALLMSDQRRKKLCVFVGFCLCAGTGAFILVPLASPSRLAPLFAPIFSVCIIMGLVGAFGAVLLLLGFTNAFWVLGEISEVRSHRRVESPPTPAP